MGGGKRILVRWPLISSLTVLPVWRTNCLLHCPQVIRLIVILVLKLKLSRIVRAYYVIDDIKHTFFTIKEVLHGSDPLGMFCMSQYLPPSIE